MAAFSVDTQLLTQFGQEIKRMGHEGASPVAAYCTAYAGQTDGLTGLLSEIEPMVSGYAAEGLAYAFGQHYQALAGVISGTGRGLVDTANLYHHTDGKNRITLDNAAPRVGAVVDVRSDGNAGFAPSTYGILQPTAPDPDPTKYARDNLDIDVKACNWLFSKITGHNLTEPIVALIGNWTTLSADALAWGMIAEQWRDLGQGLTGNGAAVNHIWDGNAAVTFVEYCNRLGGSLAGEAEICEGIKLVLNQLAKAFEDTFNGAVDLLQSIIHQVETAVIWLSVGWWCGVGEAESAKEVWDAYQDFKKAETLGSLILNVIKDAHTAMTVFYFLRDLYRTVANVPGAIEGKIAGVQDAIKAVGAIPGILTDLSKLPAEPATSYSGPRAPGIS